MHKGNHSIEHPPGPDLSTLLCELSPATTPILNEMLLAALETVFTCVFTSNPKSLDMPLIPIPIVAAFAMP